MKTLKIGSDRINLLHTCWETEKLIVEDVNLNEINEIQQIFETSSNIEIWDGVKTDVDYALNCYRKGDLPPGGKKENYKMQSIKIKKHDKKLIGVIEHGIKPFLFSNTSTLYETCKNRKNNQVPGGYK